MQLSLLLVGLVPLASAFPLDVSKAFSSILPRVLTSDTQNDLIDGTPCKAITVLFARGTTSPGNMGTSTGPPFVQAIGALVGTSNIAVQGIDYPASIIGFLQGGDTAGGTLMASLTARAFSQCPNTKVVLSGYSQGGQLVHKAGILI